MKGFILKSLGKKAVQALRRIMRKEAALVVCQSSRPGNSSNPQGLSCAGNHLSPSWDWTFVETLLCEQSFCKQEHSTGKSDGARLACEPQKPGVSSCREVHLSEKDYIIHSQKWTTIETAECVNSLPFDEATEDMIDIEQQSFYCQTQFLDLRGGPHEDLMERMRLTEGMRSFRNV